MKIALPLFFLSLLFTSCQPKPFLYIGSDEEVEQLEYWFGLLEENIVPETTFSVRRNISEFYQSKRAWNQIIYLFSTYVSQTPQDPFNGLYLFYVARAYEELGSIPMAVHYYRRILESTVDLDFTQSIHFLSLRKLILLEQEPHRRLDFFKQLISRFQDEIDLGLTYYYMAQTYEELGQWDAAIQSARTFLNFPETVVPGNPEAWNQAKIKLDFHTSDKNWVNPSLDNLIANIRAGVQSNDWNRVQRLRNQVNFFGRTWEFLAEGNEMMQGEELDRMLRMQIASPATKRFASGISSELSSERESYLRTEGWPFQNGSIWYFYFRRVDYPQDPELHRGWEWAGIYFGERF